MWHCPTCDRLILDDTADCPKCGPRPADSPPAAERSNRDSNSTQGETSLSMFEWQILTASIAAGFFLLGIMFIVVSTPQGELIPMGVGCIFGSFTALVATAILCSLQAPAVSNRKIAKIQGRYSHARVPPSDVVYNTIIDLAQIAPRSLRSFMPYRPWFREAVRKRPISGLMLCMIDQDPRIQELAIFMLGLCRRTGLEPDFMEFRYSKHRFLRKRAIKALRRLAAWPQLQQIARDEFDPQLRELAIYRRTSFGDRLQRLQQSLSASAVESVETPLRVLVPLPLEPSHGPKPTWRIRAVLERIRALLGGAKLPQ